MKGLKPCPFCGHEEPHIDDGKYDGSHPRAYCPKCGAKTEQRVSVQLAAQSWNRRASELAPTDLQKARDIAERIGLRATHRDTFAIGWLIGQLPFPEDQ